MQATHSVTHTKSYQVIHQLIGTKNVQILRETARAEKLSPHPPRNYIIWPAPSRPVYFAISWPAARPAPRISARGGPHRTGLARSPHHPATNINPARGGSLAAGPRGLRAETRPAQGLSTHVSIQSSSDN